MISPLGFVPWHRFRDRAISGVCPRLPQVRHVGRLVLAPLSSAQAIHALACSASSLDPQPQLSAPCRDVILLAPGGPPGGHVPGQSQTVQHPPDSGRIGEGSTETIVDSE